MEELEKACSGTVEALQRALDNLRRMREYSTALSEACSKTEGKASRLMEMSIVCEMEKQMKVIDEFHRRMIAGLNIEWSNEKRKLSFTKRLINGAPVPKDVEFPAVLNTSVDVSWSCDELCKEDRERLVYCVEAKKATENGERGWKEVYRGKDKKCSMNELEKNTEYNVRARCVVGELQGIWSGVANFKTKNVQVKIDSAILSAEANGKAFKEILREWCRKADFELLYRGSRDGFKSSDFHKMCDNKGKTLVLVKNTSGHVFGGFASVPWGGINASYKQAPGSFLFTLTNMHGIQPTKFPLKDENDKKAIYYRADKTYGIAFGAGHDLYVHSDCNTNKASYSSRSFPNSYNDTTEKGNSIFSSDTSDCYFKVKEVEVFKVC